MENARVKERTTARAEVFQTYGLDDHLDPVEVKAHLDLLRQDPQLHAELTLDALKREGRYRPHPEEQLPNQGQSLPTADWPEPALISVDGQRAYSADQMPEIIGKAMMLFKQELGGELRPLHELHRDARAAQIRADAYTYANDAIREASNWHRFNDLRPRIKEIMVGDRRTTLLSAYNRALQEDLKQSNSQLKTETRRQTLEEINLASEANTVRPGAAATSRAGTHKSRGGGGLDARLDRAISAAVSSVAR